MRISGGMREITAIAHTCVANWMFSDRQAMILIINETQGSHVAQIVYINLGGRAEPARRRPAALTTRTVLFSWIARGGGHVYPHLDETPDGEVRLSRSNIKFVLQDQIENALIQE